MTSRRSSSRLPATSGDWSARPVTLPPGRAKLATMPETTGSAATAKTIGMTVVACLAGSTAPPVVTMTSTLSRTNSAAISGKRSLCPSAQRYSIADPPLDPPKLAQSLHEGGNPLAEGRRRAHAKETDSRQLARLLRVRRERPRGRRAADERDELASFHCRSTSRACERRIAHLGTVGA